MPDERISPQNFDEIEMLIELIWGDELPEDLPKCELRTLAQERLLEMRAT